MSNCATCKHWRGNSSTYIAACPLAGRRVEFDYGCTQWQARSTAIPIAQPASVPSGPLVAGRPYICSEISITQDYAQYNDGNYAHFVPGLRETNGVIWLKTFDPAINTNEPIHCRYRWGQSLMDFAGYITSCELIESRMRVEVTAASEPLVLHNLQGDEDTAIAAAYAERDRLAAECAVREAQERAERDAEYERKVAAGEINEDEWDGDYWD